MPHHAQFEQWIAAPLEKVFAFFAEPKNLPRIMPAWLGIKFEELVIVPPPGGPEHFAGAKSRFVATFRAIPFLPLRIRSEAQIVAFTVNEFFSDIQVKGPFRSWHHRHEFEAEPRSGVQGTLIRDRIEYEVAFTPVGGIINALFVAPQMRQTFAYRQRVIQELLGAQA